MKQRFEFSDGTSNKFWSIESTGRTNKVTFGRLGAAGLSQSHDFPNDEEALKAYNKLIAEKVAKGYRPAPDPSDDPGSTAAPSLSPISQTQSNEQPAAIESNVHQVSPMPSIVPDVADLDRPAAEGQSWLPDPENIMSIIKLEPYDWYWAAWRNLPPLKIEPHVFDKASTLKKLSTLWTKSMRREEYPWDEAGLPLVMSRTEAHFWFAAMTVPSTGVKMKSKEIANAIKDMEFGNISTNEIAAVIPKVGVYPPQLVIPLSNLLSPQELFDLILNSTGKSTGPLCLGFRCFVVPQLGEAQKELFARQIKPNLNPKRLQERKHWHWAPPEFYLAAHLGMHDDVWAVVESWSIESDWTAFYSPWQLIFGLRDPVTISEYIRKLWRPTLGTIFTRAWLANTGLAGLDFALQGGNFKILALIHSPDMVPHMLRFYKEIPDLRAPARDWLENHHAMSVPELKTIVERREKNETEARDVLNSISQKLGSTTDLSIANDYDDSVLANEETPAWLKQTSAANKKAASLPEWVLPENLTPIMLGEKKLNSSQISTILKSLRDASLDDPDPLFSNLKLHCSGKDLDAFVWNIFQRWLGEGAPVKDKWALFGLGHLGSDSIALKIAPLIRQWPGESLHQRAVLGLDVLRAIGTDTALMMLSGIATKLRYQALKDKANSCMDSIAKARQMTRAQLEDRIVPTCDLNQDASRIFDFGTRKFKLLIGPDLLPMILDADGLPKSDLPKPNSSDDKELAEASIDEWKLLKKQLKEIIKIQSNRMEEAMIVQRQWKVKEFDEVLIKHPILSQLCKRLIWCAYDKEEEVIGTFRTKASGVYEDESGNAFDLSPAAEITIVHPLQLSEESFRNWQNVLANFPISPPFKQLSREVYSLPENEIHATVLTTFADVAVPNESLVRNLETRGWYRGLAGDNGIFEEHTKYFAGAKVTAVVQYEGMSMGGFGFDEPNQSIDRVFFLKGEHEKSYCHDTSGALTLGRVDKIVMSEVLRDLNTIAEKGKPSEQD